MKLSAKATQLNDLIDTKYTRIRLLIEKGDFFNAKRSGTIDNHDTTHLLKILKYYLEDVYLNIKGIEVKLDA